MPSYRVVQKPSTMIVGIACRTSNASEAASHDIPLLWQRFYHEEIANKISNKVSNEIIALYCDYEGDYTKPYTLLIGCPVSSQDIVPEGMMAKTIPSGSYALFQALGEHPKSVIETWGNIWQQNDLARTYTGDYEVYGDNFFSGTPPRVDIFIAT